MPKYRITLCEAEHVVYEVEADDEDQATEMVFDVTDDAVVEVHREAVDSQLLETELVE